VNAAADPGAMLAREIEREHQAAYGKAREALEHARRAGELLLQAKAAVGHGQFGKWLTEHVSFAERTAQAYMRIASNWPAIEAAKTATVADLTVRGALSAVRTSTVPAKRSRAVARPMRDKNAKRMLQELDQIQVLACLLDAWDEADADTRLKFFQTLHGRNEFMPVVQTSARKAA
jgi:hypothetical protein